MEMMIVLFAFALSLVFKHVENVLVMNTHSKQLSHGKRTKYKLSLKQEEKQERIIVKDSKVYDLFTGRELLTIGEVLALTA